MNPFLTLNPFDIIKKFTGGDEEVVEDFNQETTEELTAEEIMKNTRKKPYPNYVTRNSTTPEWLSKNDTLDKRKLYTRNKLSERVKNPNSVIGILANIQGENQDFDWKKIQDLNKYGDELGEGIGIFQFDFMKDGDPYKNPVTGETAGRNYNTYLENTNQLNSADAQIDYAMDQIYGDPSKSILGGGKAKELRGILDNPKTTPEEATRAFFRIFENPVDPKGEKLNKRLDYIKMFKSGGGSLIERNPYNN